MFFFEYASPSEIVRAAAFFCGVGELRRWRDVIAPHSLIRKFNSEQTAEPYSLFLIDSRSNKFVDYQSK